MRFFFLIAVILFCCFSVAQKRKISTSIDNSSSKLVNDSKFNSTQKKISDNKKESPPINLYKIYTLEKDTTYADTSLTLKNEYKYNYLRKDNFGLIPFANEGHTYNTLNFGLVHKSISPTFGFTAKHFNYLEARDIKYYSVPTPFTELYYKTVMEQGQSLDAFLTINTKPNLNFSIAYKGLRSIGKYINNIASTGNFRFTSSYFTKDKRYFLNAHFVAQDISNQENGGIIDVSLFEASESPNNQRDRLDVYFRDANSLLKGNRVFLDHYFKLNKDNPNSLIFSHQFSTDYKFFEFTQPTLSSRFGDSFSSSINNKTRFNNLYNKFGVGYKTKNYGNIEFYLDDTNYNYYYDSIVYDNSGNISVPNSISDRINMMGGTYTYFANKLVAKMEVAQSITNQSISNIQATAKYTINSDYQFEFQYQKLNSLPNLNYTLYQSRYVDYNWVNNFKNEKLNQFSFSALTKWINASAQFKVINDHLYFDNITNDITKLTVKPMQYNKTINYLSINANKEVKFWKLGLDVTVLYQKVDQAANIVNVPELTTRSTLYFSDHVFKKAMLLQTGITFQYFTKYYGNDYNPLIGEFYVQNETKFGDFPLLDFFVNARIKQTRIYLKAEHFNSSFTGYNYYSAPNYPYRDFMIRFGLEWNFFK